jgi:hypothetical protein
VCVDGKINNLISNVPEHKTHQFLSLSLNYACGMKSCLYSLDVFHVDGVRLRLWTAATNGPIVHPPGDIWAGEPWRNDVGRGELIHPPRLSCNATSSNLVANQVYMAKKIINLALRVFFFHSCKCSFSYRKILRHGADGLLPLRRKACCGFLSPRPGLNPRTLGSMPSTLTIKLPRRHHHIYIHRCENVKSCILMLFFISFFETVILMHNLQHCVARFCVADGYQYLLWTDSASVLSTQSRADSRQGCNYETDQMPTFFVLV